MGYTHYWAQNVEHGEGVTPDLQKVGLVYDDALAIAKACNDKGILVAVAREGGDLRLNGSEGVEALVFPGRRMRGFCKTEWCPYDLAVCATLLSVIFWLGDEFNVTSDGISEVEGERRIDASWSEARDFYAALFQDRDADSLLDRVPSPSVSL